MYKSDTIFLPNIVVLDGFTLNPGDLSWDVLQLLGNCTIYDRSDVADIVERSVKADILVVNKATLNSETLQKLSNLKFIAVTATGYNVVDVIAAREKNIPVANVPAYGSDSVAQMVFAHILNLTQQVAYHDATVKQGKWANSRDWCYWDFPLTELKHKILGIIGYGNIGRKVAEIGLAFGMNILTNTPQKIDEKGSTVRQVDLETLFRTGDVISLNCPLTEETRHIINGRSISLMKKSALIINTSRGPLVNEYDLAEALSVKRIAGAGLDVLANEPPDKNNPLINVQNCFITPHMAWATKESRQRLMDIAVDNIKCFLEGRPKNIVN